mgnify:CR=1 FL=1
MLIYKVRYNTHICVHHTLFQVFFLTVIPFRRSNHISTFLRFIEYTCLAPAIIEVLSYTVEPRSCSYAISTKCCFIHSKGVGAYMLLKLYISSTQIHIQTVVMNKSCRFSTLDTPSLCTYHLHDRSTQQKSCEIEIVIFPDFFMTQQTVAK